MRENPDLYFEADTGRGKMKDYFLFLVLLAITLNIHGALSDLFDGNGSRGSYDDLNQRVPTCPLGETCTIDHNCAAPDGTSFCVKDLCIKKCHDGQASCQLFDGTTGCSESCDGIPECSDMSDETACNKYKCQAKWRLVYEHDVSGNSIYGKKAELRDAIRKGAEVRIFSSGAYVDTPETTYIIGDEICGQHIFHVSKASWSTFQSDAYWWFIVLCTTGDLFMSRWNVGIHSPRGDSQISVAIKWFIREIPDRPLLNIPATGRNLNALMNAVKESGYGVTVKQRAFQTNEEYFTSDNVEISQDGTRISSQAVWSLFTQTDDTVVKVATTGKWVFKNFVSDGSAEFSRYLVGENTREAVDTVFPSPSDWFFDPCWELVYASNADGSSNAGSIQRLIDKIKAGNRVKVLVKNRISRASVVLVNGGVVTALLPNLLKKSNISSLEDPVTGGAKWEWTLVNTNGKIETANYVVGGVKGWTSSSTAEIKWFVDRRQWQEVLDFGPSNSVNSGSVSQLAREVRNGADVRFAWVSITDVYTVMEADNIGYDRTTDNFGAMHIRSLSLTSVGNEYQFNITSGTPTWEFTITTNTGTVRTSKWEVGNHVPRGGGETNNRVIWWIAN